MSRSTQDQWNQTRALLSGLDAFFLSSGTDPIDWISAMFSYTVATLLAINATGQWQHLTTETRRMANVLQQFADAPPEQRNAMMQFHNDVPPGKVEVRQ